MIPNEAVEAAAKYLADKFNWNGDLLPVTAREVLEAAAPHLLSHEREQTRLAHLDAMVNRETKQAELAAAWDEGYLACVDDIFRDQELGKTGQRLEDGQQNPYRKTAQEQTFADRMAAQSLAAVQHKTWKDKHA